MPVAPFDAVMLIGFGGPESPDEIRPFLQHVLRGRPVPPARLEEVAHHYELIGGRSPINALTEQQRVALVKALAEVGVLLPVRTGMWHAKPFIADTLQLLAAQGAKRILGLVMASFHDTVTIARYAAAVTEALALPHMQGVTLEYTAGPHDHAGFLAANVARVRDAYAQLPQPLADSAELVFTAHSVPTAVGKSSGYVTLFETTAARVAAALGKPYRVAYQSRSGAPTDPWLEPDIGDVIRERAAAGVTALVVAPLGFVCDHVEVLFDLDVEAAQIAGELGVTLARAGTAGLHPAYIGALADSVTRALAH